MQAHCKERWVDVFVTKSDTLIDEQEYSFDDQFVCSVQSVRIDPTNPNHAIVVPTSSDWIMPTWSSEYENTSPALYPHGHIQSTYPYSKNDFKAFHDIEVGDLIRVGSTPTVGHTDYLTVVEKVEVDRVYNGTAADLPISRYTSSLTYLSDANSFWHGVTGVSLQAPQNGSAISGYTAGIKVTMMSASESFNPAVSAGSPTLHAFGLSVEISVDSNGGITSATIRQRGHLYRVGDYVRIVQNDIPELSQAQLLVTEVLEHEDTILTTADKTGVNTDVGLGGNEGLLTGPVENIVILDGGSGYTNGEDLGVFGHGYWVPASSTRVNNGPLLASAGANLELTLTVVAGSVKSAAIKTPGTGYFAGEIVRVGLNQLGEAYSNTWAEVLIATVGNSYYDFTRSNRKNGIAHYALRLNHTIDCTTMPVIYCWRAWGAFFWARCSNKCSNSFENEFFRIGSC